jgi:hypothetical protein
MKKHNKMIALLLAVVFCFLLVLSGCNTGTSGSSPNASGSSPNASGSTAPSADTSGGSGSTVDSGKTSIKIGFVAPLSGPMANFTVGIKHAAELALDAMNKDGGILVNELGKKLPVEIIWGDSESSPTKASEVATKLATSDKVDILVGEWTPDTANPVSVVGERYQIPPLVSGAPDTSWLANGPYEWSFALMFNYDFFLDEYFNGFDRLDTNKKIGSCSTAASTVSAWPSLSPRRRRKEATPSLIPDVFRRARRTTPPSLIKFKAKTAISLSPA